MHAAAKNTNTGQDRCEDRPPTSQPQPLADVVLLASVAGASVVMASGPAASGAASGVSPAPRPVDTPRMYQECRL